VPRSSPAPLGSSQVSLAATGVTNPYVSFRVTMNRVAFKDSPSRKYLPNLRCTTRSKVMFFSCGPSAAAHRKKSSIHFMLHLWAYSCDVRWLSARIPLLAPHLTAAPRRSSTEKCSGPNYGEECPHPQSVPHPQPPPRGPLGRGRHFIASRIALFADIIAS